MNRTSQISRELPFAPENKNKLTHYAFRFPAKFHVPVARALIERFTRKHETCLDPFCGSGTLLIEAAVSGRHSIGFDVDPLSTFISKTKAARIHPDHLQRECKRALEHLRMEFAKDVHMRSYVSSDMSDMEFEQRVAQEDLRIPPIPNLHHWFRKSVIIQLARLKVVIDQCSVDVEARDFLRLCFASIIRACSNADPTPVSGLEVTSYMRKKEERGRLIDVEKQFVNKVQRSLLGSKEYYWATDGKSNIEVKVQDARLLADISCVADAVISSPPYHSAVDYYRRHQLEVFWLSLVQNQEDRVRLIPKYIGRARVAKRLLPNVHRTMGELGKYWTDRICKISETRADDFRHYYWSMREFFLGVRTVLRSGSPLVLVVGNNKVQGETVHPVALFDELARPGFSLEDSFTYPVKNRYMWYTRRNGASIDREYVLCWRRT